MLLLPLLTSLLHAQSPGPHQDSLFLSHPVDSIQLSRIADSLTTVWQESGHLLARTQIQANGNQIRWKIESGPLLQWREIRSSHDSVFTPYAMLRLSGLHRGDLATPSSLTQASDKIQTNGCSDQEAPAELRGQRGTTWADAWLPLKALPCSHAQAAFGWESRHGMQGQVDVLLANLLGSARSLELSASSKAGTRNFDLAWHEPWLGDWDIGVDARLTLLETPDHQLRKAQAQSLWPAPVGTWIAGLEASSDLLLTGTDSSLETTSYGTRLGWKWARKSRSTWLQPDRAIEASLTTLQAHGTERSWRLRGLTSLRWGWHPFQSLALATRLDAQGLLPLDSSATLGESHAVGGSNDWKGHQEGQFQTPQWAVGEFELRTGSDAWGLAAFFSPGAVWLQQHPHLGIGYGTGLHWARPSGDIRLDLAGNEEIRSWQDILVHLSLQNRF